MIESGGRRCGLPPDFFTCSDQGGMEAGCGEQGTHGIGAIEALSALQA